MKFLLIPLLILTFLAPIQSIDAQKRKKNKTSYTPKTVSLDAFQLRNVGPAFLSVSPI